MTQVARIINDRIAIGDNKFTMETLPDGRIQLTPAPDSVLEPGTDVNKALLQPIEDKVTWIMNSIFNNIVSNPFHIQFAIIDNLTITGIWNEDLQRIEC